MAKEFGYKIDNNPLMKGDIPGDYPPKEPKKFIDYLEELFTCSTNQYHIRLARGFWYFFNLTKLVEEHLKKPSDFYFTEIHPKKIIFRKIGASQEPKELDTDFVIYNEQINYHNDLRNDLVFTKIMMHNYQGNPYIPSLFSSMRREIILDKIEDRGDFTEQDINRYRYKYSFFDKHESVVKKNDWIIIKQINQSRNFLFRVTSVNPKNKIVELKYIPPTSSNIERSDFDYNSSNLLNRCIYYKNINPCIYYFHMLGIYLYNIFFLGVNEKNNFELVQRVFDKINIEQYFTILNEEEVKISFSPLQDKNVQKSDALGQSVKLQQIQKLLAHMYLKLTFVNAKDSYYSSYDKDIDRILSVKKDVFVLEEKIADLLGIDLSGKLESYMSDEALEQYSDRLSFLNEEETDFFLPFHELVFDSVSINDVFYSGNQPKIWNKKIPIVSAIAVSFVAVLCAFLIGLLLGSQDNNIQNSDTESLLLKPFLYQLNDYKKFFSEAP
ncbi:MAG: hypothetical protein QNJ41_08575 [Xenococcaceae cyanobacterium MO_188.B32]|nr:hypothetical protein [Xenococcaceae cyanobacterium MO_188.B32]